LFPKGYRVVTFAIEQHLIEPTDNMLFTWAHRNRRG
jgi:hypothetical protein